jgi:protein TonB
MSVRTAVRVACCLFFSVLLSAQHSSPDKVTPSIVCTIPRGKIVHMVQPIYPREARTRLIEGDIVLRLRLAKDGTVKKMTTARGNPILAESAEKAVAQWRYRPYLLNGKPVEVETEVTVRFRLSEKKARCFGE